MKPCPFCGYKKIKLCKQMSRNDKVLVGWFAVCEPDDYACGSHGPIFMTKAMATRAWQKRVKQ